jgi:hypothetical protein
MKKIYLIVIALFISASAKAIDSIKVSEAVIVDPKIDVFYVMTANQKLIALKSNGEELWQTPLSARPLFVQDQHLISMNDSSQPGILELLLINTKNGEVLNKNTIPLPKTVFARINDTYDQSFDLDVRKNAGEVQLVWKFIHNQVGGVFNEADENTPIEKARGGFNININGKLKKLSAIALKSSEIPTERFIVPQQLKSHWQKRDIVTEPVLFGNNYHSIGYDSGMAYIKSFNKADGSVTKKLKINQPLSHLYKLSAGKEFVAIPQRLTGSSFYRYDWSITSMLDGQKLGSIKSPYSAGDYYVKSNSIYYVEGPWKRRMGGNKYKSQEMSFIAYDFSMEKQLWSVEIRDTRYSGATPP